MAGTSFHQRRDTLPAATTGTLQAPKVGIKLGDTTLEVPFVSTFGDVPQGQPLLYIDSSDLLSVAINQGNFAQVHGVVPPVALSVKSRSSKDH
jgi:S-adenosylmethionine hydrolase